MNKINRKYESPPIVEALCEIHFDSTEPWDLTLPGLIYEKIKNEYPERHQQVGINIEFKPSDKGFEHKFQPAAPRIQFFKKDKTALIQIAPDLLIINQLKPYPTWKKFKPTILKMFELYKKLAKPKLIKKISLRYINLINIKELKLEKYFNLYPNIPSDLSNNSFESFFNKVEFSMENKTEYLVITLATASTNKKDNHTIVLDLEFKSNATDNKLNLKDISHWLDKAHEKIEIGFEASITETLRKNFKEKNQ